MLYETMHELSMAKKNVHPGLRKREQTTIRLLKFFLINNKKTKYKEIRAVTTVKALKIDNCFITTVVLSLFVSTVLGR